MAETIFQILKFGSEWLSKIMYFPISRMILPLFLNLFYLLGVNPYNLHRFPFKGIWDGSFQPFPVVRAEDSLNTKTESKF